MGDGCARGAVVEKGASKPFQFDWRNTYNGEPDAQTRRDWVTQMGTPYPHAHVMRLFREARVRHEKRKGRGDRARRAKRSRVETKPSVLTALTLDLSEDEGSEPERAQETETASSDDASEAAPTSPCRAQPSKTLVQTRIDRMFQPSAAAARAAEAEAEAD